MYGQSPNQMVLIDKDEVSSQSISSNNPWRIGAKLSFAVRDLDGSLEDNFIFSGKATGNLIQGPRYAIPVYGTIGLGSDDIFSSESGFNAGIYPYYKLTTGTNVHLTAHGGLGYKVIPGGEDIDAFNQVKILGGVEAAFYGSDGTGLPVTFSVTPVYLFNNGLIANTSGFEGTLIFPVASGMGILAEYFKPFNSEFDGVFRLGVITVGIL